MRKKYTEIIGEVGQELREAQEAYRAEMPNPSREVKRRYMRIKGALLYLREKRGLNNEQISKVKLSDVPNYGKAD